MTGVLFVRTRDKPMFGGPVLERQDRPKNGVFAGCSHVSFCRVANGAKDSKPRHLQTCLPDHLGHHKIGCLASLEPQGSDRWGRPDICKECDKQKKYIHMRLRSRREPPLTKPPPTDRTCGGVQGHPSHYGFGGDGVNVFEDYPSPDLPSGRTTPLAGCRGRRAGIHDVQYAASHMSGLKSGGFPITS